MGYTGATTNHLGQLEKKVSYCFELKTNAEGGDSWQEYPFVDFALSCDVASPATLRVELCNDELEFSDEESPGCRTQLLADARLSCTLAGETETLFQGRVWRVEPRD